VPFSKLTKEERHMVFEGPATKRMIVYPAKNGKMFELNASTATPGRRYARG
jgi:excinuclease ABC subunit A